MSRLLTMLQAGLAPCATYRDAAGEATLSGPELWRRAGVAANRLARAGVAPGAPVALLAESSVNWLACLLGCWRLGAIAVPLSTAYPADDIDWFVADIGAKVLVTSPGLAMPYAAVAPALPRLDPAALVKHGAAERVAGPASGDGEAALILYTSGTTGRPKGAILSHGNLAQHADLIGAAWSMGPEDTLLHALPLHHLHGLGISLLTGLCAGSSVHLLPRFDARQVWRAFASGAVTVWMGVPTMYHRLFAALDAEEPESARRWRAGASALRLATSGSAALPVTLAARWAEVTGQIPLERYGMTEIGVAASNPLDAAERARGSVGFALPTVELRLVDPSGQDVPVGASGEVWVRGPSVFARYHRRDDATRDAFVDGWFRTGDIGVADASGRLRLQGRTSVDILKSGGYKLSALEIEEVLRDHPDLSEVAVVGVDDEAWGQRVVAVVVPCDWAAAPSPEALRAWAKERLASYKVPRTFVLRSDLPRNPVGKVLKKELAASID